MMDGVPYSLRYEKNNSEQYYRDVAEFVKEVLEQAEMAVGEIVIDFLAKEQQGQSETECMLDLLTMGVLWRTYYRQAGSMGVVHQWFLSHLVVLRRKGGIIRPGLDLVYGILRGISFYQKQRDDNGLSNLLNWLTTSDEFYYEEKRLRAWYDYFVLQDPQETAESLDKVVALADWFITRGQNVLGRYTENVQSFQREVGTKRRWREDYVATNRSPAEYHLNMVGAEILNEVFRHDFVNARQKSILLPACMCLQQSECQAEMTGPGYLCSGCTVDCRVHILTSLGQKHGFAVYIVPHTTSLFQLRNTGLLYSSGVIGIACVTNLLNGGWMLKAAGIPAQCVLLDYCGCKRHWHKDGIPTDINMSRLEDVLQLNTGLYSSGVV